LNDFHHMKMMRVVSPVNLVTRDHYRIHHAGKEFVLLLLQLTGSATFSQAGRSVSLKPGDMTLYDSVMPHLLNVEDNYSSLILRASRDYVLRRLPTLPYITAMALPNRDGMGRVALEMIRTVSREADRLTGSAALSISDMVWDTLAQTAGVLTDGPESRLPVSANKMALLQRIKFYIDTCLAEPFLTPAHIAGEHHISVRYLNKLFATEGTSVTRWIRSRRLERCARAMTSATYSGRSIHEISFSWGFNNISYFSREFKEAYGCTAREYRQRHRKV